MKFFLLHDSTQDGEFIKDLLHKIPEFECSIHSVETPEALVRRLEAGDAADLILLSYQRPGTEGLDLLRNLDETEASLPPVLLIAGQGDERTAVEFMKQGALDYLLKEDINTEALKKSIGCALEKTRLERDLAEANKTIQEMAFTDGLTGLFNRHFFNEALRREYENALRYNYPLSCIMADLDYFKETNDRFGHLVGDAALRQVSATVQNLVRSGDVAARYGGDEFVILLPHTPLQGAVILAERIQSQLRADPVTSIPNKRIYLTASFGISSLMPGSFFSKEDLMNQADHALYRAKEEGRNRIAQWQDDFADSPSQDPGEYPNMLGYYKRSLQRLQLKVKGSYIELCETLVKAIESRDPLVVDFSKRVMRLAVSTAMQLGLPADEVEIVKNAAMLHDIGMIGIPDTILLKKNPLTPEEMKCIRRHPAIGMEMLIHVTFLDRERQIILQHHEWFNGEGYPSGIRGERIPIGARIISVVDSFVAMCDDRTHRKGMERRRVIEKILRDKGRKFDPAVVDAFIAALERTREKDPIPPPARDAQKDHTLARKG